MQIQLELDPALFGKVIKELNPPAPYIPTWFLKELNELGGFADDGKTPQLRIGWGGELTQFWRGRMRIKYPKYTDKMAIGWEVLGENGERLLYPLNAANELTHLVGRLVYDWIDIGIPMFVIEEWIPPEIACDGWEKRRYEWDAGNRVWIDKLGPEPREGLYRKLVTLAEFKGDMMFYMPPNEQTLVYIKKMLWLQRQEPMLYSKRERPPDNLVEQLLRKRYDEVEKWETKFEDDLADRMVDRVRRSSLAPTSYASTKKTPKLIIAHK